MFVFSQGFPLFIIQPSIAMASHLSFLFILSSLNCFNALPEYCYNYYSEFALDEHYNPAIYPEINTTITDITTLYKVSEVRWDRLVNRHCLIYYVYVHSQTAEILNWKEIYSSENLVQYWIPISHMMRKLVLTFKTVITCASIRSKII